ncbi:MAG: hypothetical protein AB7Q17_14550 [Phycisphaerae bacterium]
MRFPVRRLSMLKRGMLAIGIATVFQAGACSLTPTEQQLLNENEVLGVAGTVIGNLVANTINFFLNNALIGIYG